MEGLDLFELEGFDVLEFFFDGRVVADVSSLIRVQRAGHVPHREDLRFLQLAFELGDRLGSEQLEFFGVKSRFSEHFSHDIEHIEKRFSLGLNAHAQDLAGRLDAQIGFEFIEPIIELLEWHLGGPTRKHGAEHFDCRRLALERILVSESQVQRDVDGASTGFLREHRKGDPRLELALGHP